MKYVSPLLRFGVLVALFFQMWSSISAQTPTWQTAMAINSDITITTTATDGAGNIYMGGYFNATTFLGNTLLFSVGNIEGFVAKWNVASASFVWAKQIGGTRNDEVTGLSVKDTTVYVTGNFASPSLNLGATSLVNASANNNDVFVAKLLDTGPSSRFEWAQRIGGINDEKAGAVVVNGTNIYVAGTFSSVTLNRWHQHR